MIDPLHLYKELAMFWLQKQDLSGLTPEKLFQKYQYAYNAIADEDAKQKGVMRISS